MNDFSKNLKKIRKSKKETQKSLAEKVGVASTYIANIEQGVRSPSLALINKLAEVLAVKTKKFFEENHD